MTMITTMNTMMGMDMVMDTATTNVRTETQERELMHSAKKNDTRRNEETQNPISLQRRMRYFTC